MATAPAEITVDPAVPRSPIVASAIRGWPGWMQSIMLADDPLDTAHAILDSFLGQFHTMGLQKGARATRKEVARSGYGPNLVKRLQAEHDRRRDTDVVTEVLAPDSRV